MLVVMRRFWIRPGSFDEFERLSREEIWPAIEAAGARVLGMFRAEEPHPHDEVDDPCEMVILLTQYTDREHWRATRAREDTWRGPQDVRDKLARGARARHELTLATQPTFTEPVRVKIGGPLFSWKEEPMGDVE